LLDSLNGVLLTGGPVQQADPITHEPHVYVKTAQKIFDYAKREFDEGRYFPILGICQGFQIINTLANGGDHYDTISKVYVSKESRRVNWTVPQPKVQSRMFKDYPQEYIDLMASRNY
jgi:gamma-glutamyl-gamma-aminobutyrate hydrolase PuuD